MKKQIRKPLRLDRETVRTLRRRELDVVVGGVTGTCQAQTAKGGACPGTGGCETVQ